MFIQEDIGLPVFSFCFITCYNFHVGTYMEKKKHRGLKIALICVCSFLAFILAFVGGFLIFASATTLKVKDVEDMPINGEITTKVDKNQEIKLLTWNVGYGDRAGQRHEQRHHRDQDRDHAALRVGEPHRGHHLGARDVARAGATERTGDRRDRLAHVRDHEARKEIPVRRALEAVRHQPHGHAEHGEEDQRGGGDPAEEEFPVPAVQSHGVRGALERVLRDAIGDIEEELEELHLVQQVAEKDEDHHAQQRTAHRAHHQQAVALPLRELRDRVAADQARPEQGDQKRAQPAQTVHKDRKHHVELAAVGCPRGKDARLHHVAADRAARQELREEHPLHLKAERLAEGTLYARGAQEGEPADGGQGELGIDAEERGGDAPWIHELEILPLDVARADDVSQDARRNAELEEEFQRLFPAGLRRLLRFHGGICGSGGGGNGFMLGAVRFPGRSVHDGLPVPGRIRRSPS